MATLFTKAEVLVASPPLAKRRMAHRFELSTKGFALSGKTPKRFIAAEAIEIYFDCDLVLSCNVTCHS